MVEGKSGLSFHVIAVGAKRRPMTNSAKQSSDNRGLDCFVAYDPRNDAPKSARTFANTLRNISGVSTRVFVL